MLVALILWPARRRFRNHRGSKLGYATPQSLHTSRALCTKASCSSTAIPRHFVIFLLFFDLGDLLLNIPIQKLSRQRLTSISLTEWTSTLLAVTREGVCSCPPAQGSSNVSMAPDMIVQGKEIRAIASSQRYIGLKMYHYTREEEESHAVSPLQGSRSMASAKSHARNQ